MTNYSQVSPYLPTTQLKSQSLTSDINKIMKFLNTKIQNKSLITIKEYTTFLKGNIFRLISDKELSKKMQKIANTLDEYSSEELLKEIAPHISNSEENEFCNYFYQKYFKYLSLKQRIKLLYLFKNNFIVFSYQKTGVHLIVSLIDKATSQEEYELIKEQIKFRLTEFITNSNAFRVIKSFILTFSNEKSQFIFDFILANVMSLYTYESFVNLISSIISKLSNSFIETLYKIISSNFLLIVKDTNGIRLIILILTEVKFLNKKYLFNSFIESFSDLVQNSKWKDLCLSFIHIGGTQLREKIIFSLYDYDEDRLLSLLNNKSFYSFFKRLIQYYSNPDKIYLFAKLKNSIYKLNEKLIKKYSKHIS